MTANFEARGATHRGGAPRALSIHIGVNRPRDTRAGDTLRHSEDAAWRMAELATRAGYLNTRVLRGAEATLQAARESLAAAAATLDAGDTLFLSFSGHGARTRDLDGDEFDGCDEGWCLHDGVLLDDELAELWKSFAGGVRVLVVAESCFGGGCCRDGECSVSPRRGGPVLPYATGLPASCIAEAPHDAHGIGASLLVLSAAREAEAARDGVFTRELMHVWNDGRFAGTYCDLFREVCARVMDRGPHEPQILMLGAPDSGFPLEPAFHLNAHTRRRVPLRQVFR